MRLYIFRSALIFHEDKMMLAGRRGGGPLTIPVCFYLIDHPKGLVLFDTGMRLDNWPLEEQKNAAQEPDQLIDKQLIKLGIRPEDVKYVIMSHFHDDHTGGMTVFPQATFIARKAELRAAWWPDKYQWAYNYADYKDTRYFKFIELNDTEDFDVFLDGSIVCIDTKGHTQGHQSLVLNLPHTGKTVLTADAAHLSDVLNEGALPFVWNAEASVRAIARIQHLRDNGAFVIMAHDPDQFKTLKVVPEYYD
jgi:N-acyl homoserine lactone hydrolase